MKAATSEFVATLLLSAISIHAAREGGDYAVAILAAAVGEFQSTPPVKAATLSLFPENVPGSISIHAAREGGDPLCILRFCGLTISIHAAREGGDCPRV